MVLGVTMVVSVLALGAIMVRRIERKTCQSTADMAEARLYAYAAIEAGRLRIKNEPNWRSVFPNGPWSVDKPIGSGTYSLEGIDPVDGVLEDSINDPLVLLGTGRKGAARQRMQVTLVPKLQGLTCLEVSLHANVDLIFDSSTVNGNQIISANNKIQAVGACTINPASEAVNGFTGAVGPGPTTSGITPRTMPDSATVFDYYLLANGTFINYSSLPAPSGSAEIVDVVISPNNNPYDPPSTNLQGIYVIDCMGGNIGIQRSRIVGTLVLLNVGASSAILGEVNWEAAVANYPCLLVSGNMGVQMNGGGTLDEALLGVNFNPVGTPYQGVEDGDMLDSYPSVIKGLVYISGDSLMQSSPVFEGVVVVGNTLSTSTGLNLGLTYNGLFLNDAPPGFGNQGTMVVSPGTWKQTVD